MTDGARLEVELARDSKSGLVYDGAKNLMSSSGLSLPYYIYECYCTKDKGFFYILFTFIYVVLPEPNMFYLLAYYLLSAMASTIYTALYYKLCTRPVNIIILACSSRKT